MLYVMSDNHDIIIALEKIYNDKLFYIEDIIRSSDNIHLTILEKDKYDKYKLGEDVLIETVLLSKCDKIIITSSNVSNYAMVLNPYIKYHYIDMDFKNWKWKW